MADLRLPNLNSVTLAGYATSAPELRNTDGGATVANFSLGYNQRYQRAGEWENRAHFFRCVAWGDIAERAAQFITKGTAVLVEGSLQQRTWEKDGQRQERVEVKVYRLQVLSKEPTDPEPAEEPPF